MIIGEKIKELRKKNGLTQENLADSLHISYQAVSKWETGTASPDLSLIAPLTKILHTTADDLLGINDAEPDARYEELKKEYDQTYATEDWKRRQEICETAVKEYPGDKYFLCKLAWVIAGRSYEHEDNESYFAEKDKAIKLFEAVIKNCTDEYLRADAIVGITQLLGSRGRVKEGKQYAEMLPEKPRATRESVMEYLLKGNELLRFRQQRIHEHFGYLLNYLMLLNHGEYSELICKLIETMIPDGNCILYHLDVYFAKAETLNEALKNGEKEKSLALLEDMKYRVEEHDKVAFDAPGVYKYTVPHLRYVEENTRKWLGNQSERWCARFQKLLNGKEFDFLRGEERFQKLVQ